MIHQDWSTNAFDLPPIADQVGPFPGRDWLQTWWEARGKGELLLAETPDSLAAFTLTDNRLEFAGEADLTDYHSPLGTMAATTLDQLVSGLPDGVEIVLDSLPADAAGLIGAALTELGCTPATAQHEVTAVLQLPESFDDYLAGLSKKERHELRRKRRRFDNELGPAQLERRSGADAVALFADLHRRSSGDKGTFMTAAMEQFFGALHADAGGLIDVLVDGSGQPAAAIFSFTDNEGFYLYNSAYEPEVGHLSPGNVILSHLIENAIAAGFHIFDFLKGAESYKFRLGASARPLFAVTATTGRAT